MSSSVLARQLADLDSSDGDARLGRRLPSAPATIQGSQLSSAQVSSSASKSPLPPRGQIHPAGVSPVPCLAQIPTAPAMASTEAQSAGAAEGVLWGSSPADLHSGLLQLMEALPGIHSGVMCAPGAKCGFNAQGQAEDLHTRPASAPFWHSTWDQLASLALPQHAGAASTSPDLLREASRHPAQPKGVEVTAATASQSFRAFRPLPRRPLLDLSARPLARTTPLRSTPPKLTGSTQQPLAGKIPMRSSAEFTRSTQQPSPLPSANAQGTQESKCPRDLAPVPPFVGGQTQTPISASVLNQWAGPCPGSGTASASVLSGPQLPAIRNTQQQGTTPPRPSPQQPRAPFTPYARMRLEDLIAHVQARTQEDTTSSTEGCVGADAFMSGALLQVYLTALGSGDACVSQVPAELPHGPEALTQKHCPKERPERALSSGSGVSSSSGEPGGQAWRQDGSLEPGDQRASLVSLSERGNSPGEASASLPLQYLQCISAFNMAAPNAPMGRCLQRFSGRLEGGEPHLPPVQGHAGAENLPSGHSEGERNGLEKLLISALQKAGQAKEPSQPLADIRQVTPSENGKEMENTVTLATEALLGPSNPEQVAAQNSQTQLSHANSEEESNPHPCRPQRPVPSEKKMRRLASNRASAKRARQRRHGRLQELEVLSVHLQEESKDMEERLLKARAQAENAVIRNEDLKEQIRGLRELLRISDGGREGSDETCNDGCKGTAPKSKGLHDIGQEGSGETCDEMCEGVTPQGEGLKDGVCPRAEKRTWDSDESDTESTPRKCKARK